MRSYDSVCQVPLIRIAGTKVPRLVLGHLPFVGESYQGSAKNAEYLGRFSDIGNILPILVRAVRSYGMTVVSAPTPNEGTLARGFLRAIQQASQETGIELGLLVCLKIPLLINGYKVDDYRRWLTYYHIEKKYGEEELLRRYLSDPILQAREGWQSKFLERLKNSYPYSHELEKLSVDYSSVNKALSDLKANVLFLELGSETDFLSMGNRLDLLEDLVNWIHDTYEYRCILGSHHAGSTIPILDSSRIKFHGYVTPANRLGIMMYPTQKSSEAVIKSSNKPIIAIKPFAGGRITPKNALKYIYSSLNISCCMIGAASVKELDEDASAALEILSK
jgi:hypothetical protein